MATVSSLANGYSLCPLLVCSAASDLSLNVEIEVSRSLKLAIVTMIPKH